MIFIVSDSQVEADQIQAMLAEEGYRSNVIPTIEDLNARLVNGDGMAAFIDIDSIPVDNRHIRKLTLKHPTVYFFCISRDKFHPELKDAICYHIYACLNKPVDPDELVYWLRCIERSDADSRAPPRIDNNRQKDNVT